MTRLTASEIRPTPGLGSLAFRFLVAVDIAGFSRRPAAEQARAQDDLENAMTHAAMGAGLDRERWYRQPRGDGDLAVLPHDVNGLSLLADYPRRLAAAIADVNLTNGGSRLRLRLAIHHGAVAPGRFGPVGTALVTISRLLDAEVVRQHLCRRSDLDVALIISATVYDEIIWSGLCNLTPEAFRRVTTRVKGISYVGYLYEDSSKVQDYIIPALPRPITAESPLARSPNLYPVGNHDHG